jgi:hypothetical protein
MAKDYRTRGLNVKTQIAKPSVTDASKPMVDERGQPVLDFDGLWFLKVSGSDIKDDRKRALPEDWKGFFMRDVKAVQEALKVEGVTDQAILDQVTIDAIYASEYVTKYRRPTDTYAPPSHPDQFTLVVPKELCVNMTGGGSMSNGHARPSITPLTPDASALFQRLKAAGTKGKTATPSPMPVPAKKRGEPATA